MSGLLALPTTCPMDGKRDCGKTGSSLVRQREGALCTSCTSLVIHVVAFGLFVLLKEL